MLDDGVEHTQSLQIVASPHSAKRTDAFRRPSLRGCSWKRADVDRTSVETKFFNYAKFGTTLSVPLQLILMRLIPLSFSTKQIQNCWSRQHSLVKVGQRLHRWESFRKSSSSTCVTFSHWVASLLSRRWNKSNHRTKHAALAEQQAGATIVSKVCVSW